MHRPLADLSASRHHQDQVGLHHMKCFLFLPVVVVECGYACDGFLQCIRVLNTVPYSVRVLLSTLSQRFYDVGEVRQELAEVLCATY